MGETKKRGRPKLIESPEVLWKMFQDYEAWCKDNPIIKEEAIKSGRGSGEVVDVKLTRPLTISGFCRWVYEKGYTSNTEHYLVNSRGAYSEFSSISARIKAAIREQQVSGGMVGIYNANLTARLQGIGDKNILEGGDEDKPLKITGMNIT